MIPAMPVDDSAFEAQLTAFRADVATVARTFAAMATINHLASQDAALLGKLNEAPDFWNVVQEGGQTTLFITLGRIFDQNGDVPFSLLKLIRSAERGDGAIFAADRLADRKRRDSPNADEWLCDYVKEIYVPTTGDFRALKSVRKRYQKMFDATYRPIRDGVYAHGIVTREQVVKLFAATRVTDLQLIIRFLQRLDDGFWELYWNGRNPRRRRRLLPLSIVQLAASPPGGRNASDQQIMVQAVRRVMNQLGQS